MPSRESVRRELEALRQEMARKGLGATPLTITCWRTGAPGWGNEIETRSPGVYRVNGSVEVVYEGDDVPEELLAPFTPASGAGPLIIVAHADEVPRPIEEL